jgi:hypothetical protein
VTAEHEVVWVRRSRKGNEDMGSLLPFVPSDPSIYWSQDTHPQGIKENQLSEPSCKYMKRERQRKRERGKDISKD